MFYVLCMILVQLDITIIFCMQSIIVVSNDVCYEKFEDHSIPSSSVNVWAQVYIYCTSTLPSITEITSDIKRVVRHQHCTGVVTPPGEDEIM